ncbi:valine--tRNA ligase [Aciditerrimonas ferrireducens]|uniref:valine--tRNA ligase n=1 Tax=Aciditerrimonas ferrireducens TaxID=667306 RepID=UPI0020042E7A|nr:valine--tRNA ligase [Aciditerrimonas ferrireducens]MCK4177034.1 valine--tRNA ligase [Aciditerrimonas ferrireducens]
MSPLRPRPDQPARRPVLPERPALEGLEEKWSVRWEQAGTYHFDRTAPREAVFAIDTPPPTVSGSLHVGHVFSYTHADTIARYQRMQGREVFYPIGWDDNGLPTERRVQNYFGVRCDPSITEDSGPPDRAGRRGSEPPVPVSRPTFVALCHQLTAEDEGAFEALFRRLGLSVDWRHTYTTISDRAVRASQRAFLRLLRSGHAYSTEAPTLWDVDFQTAVSQAELEERPLPGAYHRLRFPLLGPADRPLPLSPPDPAGPAVEIETTRPELLAACVALVCHPDDPRYQPLVGQLVATPLFGVPVPVVAHPLADPEKGSGIAMVCTFGDTTDVVWWRELALPTRTLVGRDGRLQPAPFGSPGWESLDPAGAQRAYAELQGRRPEAARRRIAELLAEAGYLVGEPRPITHPVKFYERGERPLEIVSSRQWYVRTLPLRQRLLERGRELRWHPPHMRHRYEAWVEGLSSDWNISRQRFFGVPFPVWYPLDDEGQPDHDHPLVPPEEALPVDPSVDTPPGYRPEQRGRPGGFVGDPDVMDTWATSSLTPQIAGGWEDDPELFGRVFPMHLRPQAHEIIRTWLFSTVVRAELEHRSLPWSDVAISGWVLDPDRKKMSKSKGNVVTPLDLLERLGTDAVRYWAASGRPGVDTAFDEAQMKVGRRLAIKVLNASRFALGRLADEGAETLPGPEAVRHPLDLAMLAELGEVVREATAAFEAFDYARALERTEAFFWRFCDDYLELVKARAYGEPGATTPDPEASRSARAALGLALSILLRLLAPFQPFVTEEVWSWWHDQDASIHRAPWPRLEELPVAAREASAADGQGTLALASWVLGAIRRAKTDARRSMRSPVAQAVVRHRPEALAALDPALADLREAGAVLELRTEALPDGQEPAVAVELAELSEP